MRRDLLSTFVLLLSALIAEATRGFTYNDDVVCDYPFQDFFIESVTCAPSTFVHVLVDGAQDVNLYENENVCAFGNQMDIVGRVTISQPVSRWYFLHLNVCFKSSQIVWYANKKCMLFKSSTMDLVRSNTQIDNAYGEDQASAYQPQQILDYAEPGQYTFKSRVIVPHKTFTFKSGTLQRDRFYEVFLLSPSFTNDISNMNVQFAGYMVAAELSLVPGAHSTVADTYKFTSICTASFNAVEDQYANSSRYSNRYAAALVLTVGLLGAFLVGGKTRRLCTEGERETEAEAETPNDSFVIMQTLEKGYEEESELQTPNTSIPDLKQRTLRRGGLAKLSIISNFFRRQTRCTATSPRHSASSTVDSGVRDDECGAEHRSVELTFQKL